jgi:hypothetical protein
MVFFTTAVKGIYGSFGPFWAIPPSLLTTTAAAGAVVLVIGIRKNLPKFFKRQKYIPLSLVMGYHYRPGTANLLFATKKETPSLGDFK